jgi:uncharacterized membrane protein YgdD (TMEM256/DUF423 family)
MGDRIRFWFIMAAALALLGVVMEGLGSDVLRRGMSPEHWATYQTAARNHLYHALGLFAVSLAAARWRGPLVDAAGWLLLAGIVLFSGSLYLVAVTGRDELRSLLPGVGGVALVAGWAALLIAPLRPPATGRPTAGTET